MTMQEPVRQAVNEQVGHELESAYVYLSMSAHFEAENLPGFAQWMRKQAEEELAHAMRLFDHLTERGARVALQAVPQPPVEFGAPLAVFEQALAHEEKISSLIHDLYQLAQQHRDTPTQVMLQWFVTEQVEEENNVGQVVEKLRRAGDSSAALLFLDAELGRRQAE